MPADLLGSLRARCYPQQRPGPPILILELLLLLSNFKWLPISVCFSWLGPGISLWCGFPAFFLKALSMDSIPNACSLTLSLSLSPCLSLSGICVFISLFHDHAPALSPLPGCPGMGPEACMGKEKDSPALEYRVLI